MLHSKRFEIVCIVLVVLTGIGIVFAALFWPKLGIVPTSANPEYMARLFDDSRVHTINIQMDDWDTFIEEASEDAYTVCSLEVDGENFEGVGIRVKGNNSRSLVKDYGLERYSFKVEFDHFKKGSSYHGLDKLSLDSSFQDNSYLKNYMSYDMMEYMGVPSPACSYVQVEVNGQPWGLYLAVEETEEAFLDRQFGIDHGVIYKPDYKYLEDENADVALRYIDDNPESYDNIFRKALVDITDDDKKRLMEVLKVLSLSGQLSEKSTSESSSFESFSSEGTSSEGSASKSLSIESQNSENSLDSVVMVEETIRYFVVQTFTVNLDGYLGYTGHNYLLYEEDGKIRPLPWDYNLAYATYTLGMPNAENDPVKYVNYPIDTPAPGYIMMERPLYHKVMMVPENFNRYYELFDEFIAGYFESGLFENQLRETAEMIAPYVEQDPTKFCTYEEFLVGVDSFAQFCNLRAESVRGQLSGQVPSSFAEQEAGIGTPIDTGDLWLPDMGEVADLKE